MTAFLDTAIRARLDGFCETDMCAEDGKAALLAVLELHKPMHEVLPECSNCFARGDVTNVDYPCPTVRAIAEKLGVEADGG